MKVCFLKINQQICPGGTLDTGTNNKIFLLKVALC